MPNTYFQFKQFIIHQDKCAMKVTTDACLFGAVVAKEAATGHYSSILDIGAGTGLLSLMLAQKSTSLITAIEIDDEAYEQAKENLGSSVYKERLNIIHADIKEFHSSKKYDLIVSNPPFYENYLQSADQQKNAARHTTTLNFEVLIHAAVNNISPNGTFAVLLPYAAVEIFIAAANKAGLHLTKTIAIRQTSRHNYFRVILFFSQQQKEITQEELIIKDEQDNYSPGFTSLLQDYYLNL